MRKNFDIHTHIYPEKISEKATVNLGKFYDFHVDGKGTYADLEAHGAAAGTEGFLILGVATNKSQITSVNDFIAETVNYSRSRGFKSVGFMGIHQDCEDMASALDHAASAGLQGVKIHPDIQGVDIDDRRLLELYSLIEGKLPIYFHMGDNRPQYQFSTPEKLAKILEMFPRLEVVAAHLGGYQVWDEAWPLLAGRENVWYDTSSALWAMTTEYADKLISKLGTERVMFGTDYPVKTTAEELGRVEALALTERERENVLWNNAARFLGIE